LKDYASGNSLATGDDTKFSDVANRAAQSVRGAFEDGRALASERIDATARWVGDTTRQNPVRTLGMVAIAGIVVGLLIGRR